MFSSDVLEPCSRAMFFSDDKTEPQKNEHYKQCESWGIVLLRQRCMVGPVILVTEL